MIFNNFNAMRFQRSHNVVYETARTDLLELADKELLTANKRGRSYEFVAPVDLEERLRRYSEE